MDINLDLAGFVFLMQILESLDSAAVYIWNSCNITSTG